MSTCLSHGHHPLLSFSSVPRLQFQTPAFHRSHFSGLSNSRALLPGTLTVAKFGFLGSVHLPDPQASQGFLSELLGRAEGLFYTLSDAAVSNSDPVATGSTKQTDDWLSGITSYMETILKVLNDGLSHLHAPYAYGFAIILLTLIVKAATFPLTKKQVESAMAIRSLQPQIKAIQARYAGDQERIQLETARIYKLAGINPLAGCLPTLATIPIWIGLYRALSNVANEGLLKEGFFWIPSLAGPTTIGARQNGSGISWLFPFVDGHPPLGWSDTIAYLVLPVLLVISQYVSIQIMQSSQDIDNNDPNVKTSQTITKFLPLMIGYFALSVPSGLSLYWLTNNILSTAQQVWLQKFGGAKNPVGKISQEAYKDEQSEIEKPVVEMKSTLLGEVSPSTGPRPGERFKQLKEEEAKRRRQREEEKRRAEEIASSAVGIREDGEINPKLEKGGNGHLVEMINGENGTDCSSSTPLAANGNATLMVSKEHESTSILVEEASRQADDAGGMYNQVTEGSPDKEVGEVVNGANPQGNRSQEDSKSVQKDE